MIRYLSYYSIGGYKDIYIGTNEEGGDEEGKVYYSTFLQPWLEGKMEFSDDLHTQNQLKALKDKPQMEILTPQSKYKMSSMAKTLVTHAGYQLACCSLGNGEHSVAVRDLHGRAKDEYGRPIPFMMQFVCDEVSEANALADHFRCNLKTTQQLLGNLFEYNPHLNCITFDLATINSAVNSIIQDIPQSNITNYLNHGRLHQIMLSEGISLKYALSELGLDFYDVGNAYDANGTLLQWQGVENQTGRTNMDDDRIVAEETPYANKQGFMTLISQFIAWLKTHTNPTDEDLKDISCIKKHIKTILMRKR